jgi:hypothetical protein
VLADALDGESVLRLKRTPAEIRGNSADVDVETDADLKFSNLGGPLHVDSYGGAVVGSEARSLVEVRSQGPTVSISGVDGPLLLQGNGLAARLKGVRSETWVYVVASDVSIEDASGPLTIENDAGSIAVVRASGPLEVTGRRCGIRIEELSGTLQLETDAPEARVGWSAFPKEGESVVRNAGGGVVATFPATGACRVEARTTFGRVESEVPGVVADDLGNSAAGDVGGPGPAVIRILASGEVRLLVAKPPPKPVKPAASRPAPPR